MIRSRWLQKLLSVARSRKDRRRQAARSRKPVRLVLESLEERLTPSYDLLKISGANSFAFGAGSIAANQPSGALTVQLQDNNGNPVTASSNRTVVLSSSSSTAQFLDLSGKPLTNNSIVIPAGSSSALFEYQDSQTGNAEITADISNTSVFGQTSIDVEAELIFTTPSRVTAVNQASQPITVQLQDGNGNPITAPSDITLTLNTSSSTGTFLDTSGNPLANKSITIAAGSNSASFEYEDSSPSQASGVTIGAVQSTSSAGQGFQASSAEQQDYVGVGGAIITPTQTIVPGQASKPITIQLENAVSDDTTINLSSSSSTGQFLDTSGNPLPNNILVIPHDTTSASFEYEDSQTGTPFLSASSSDLNLFLSTGVNVGTSATPVFVTSPQTLATGQPSQPITVQLQSFGSNFSFGGGLTNAVNANSDATIQLSSSSPGGTFLDASGTPLANNTLTIKAGTSSASFEYEDSQEGFASLSAMMNSFTSIPQTENVGGVSLSFTTAAQTISTGQPSGAITVQVKDSNGNPITSGMTIGLSSNSSTGTFLDTKGNTLTSNSITIPAGSSMSSFEYEDTVGGTPTLTASIQTGTFASPGSVVSATQQETVNGPYTLTFSTYGVSATPNNPSKPIAVSLVSSNGATATAAGDVAVTLSSSSPGGTFLDASGTPLTNNTLTIKAGTSSASFEYEDTQTGIPTLTASENGFTSQQALPVGVSLVFSTAPQTLSAGQTSQPVTVQLQDGNGNAFTAPSTINLFLSSSQGVQFLDTSGKALTSNSITIPQGSSAAQFEFSSPYGGTPTLTASAESSTIPLPSGSLQGTQKETIQGLSALVFTTTPQTVAAGQMSQPVTLQLQDNNGNPVNAPSGGLNITLTGYAYGTIGVSPASVKFFDADGNPLPGNSITVPAGSNSVTFKFETTTAGSAYLQPSVTNGFSAYQNETVQAGPADSVGFLTPAQSLAAGVASGSIVVQVQDKFGNAIQAGSGGVTVNLSSSSTTGQFLSQSGDPLASPSITIPEGASTAVFEYEDSQAGTPTLTATASGVNGTQQLTITATSASIHVTNTSDSGAGSLRAAIDAANAAPGSTIVFDSGVTGTIDLMSDLPYLQASTNLVGPGANVLTIEPGPNTIGSFGGLGVGTPASPYNQYGFSTSSLQSLQPVVTITGLTVANFKGTGISNFGDLTLRQVDVSNNQAPPANNSNLSTSFNTAGGIGNSGTLTVLDSTIANNSTTGNEAAAGISSEGGSLIVINSTITGNVDNNSNSAGGIAVIDGTASIASSTISGNTASQNTVQGVSSGPGGGIEAEGTVTLYDTIVAGNTGSPANPTDLSGAFNSLGNNLIGVANSQSLGFVSSDLVGTTTNPIDPKLGSLANNGGPTPTMTLLTGSPALGAGSSANAPATDQRGDSRPQSGSIDIGSVEITTSSNSGPSITLNPKDQSAVEGQTATFTASASGNPTPAVQWQVSSDGGKTFTALSDGTESNGTIVSGSTSPTLTLSNISASLNGTVYEAQFTNSVSTATTSIATLTVTAAATPPNITTQPANQKVAAGDNVSLTAAASGSPTPTVNWQVSSDGGKTFTPLSDGTNADGTTVSGSATPTLTLSNVSATLNGNLYEATFTNSAGNATTNSAMLTVTAPVAPVITGNPSNQTVTAGQTATFKASASGDPTPSVQWQISTNGGATFSPIGGNSTTLTINNASPSFNGALVEAVFSNSAGSVTTSTATLTVQVHKTPPPPPAPPQPPVLNVPPLLQLLDSLLGGVETVNANGTETVTDSFFGFPLLVSTFDSHGNLMSVDLFGSINITFLFTLFP